MYNSAYEILPNGSVILTVFMNGELTRHHFNSMDEMDTAHSNFVTVKRVIATAKEEIGE